MIDLNIEKVSGRWYEFSIPSDRIGVELSSGTDKVRVWIPELAGRNHKVWGDWGPMYSFDLIPEEKIVIEQAGVSRELEQTTLRVEAPMKAAQRKETPFFILVQDPARGFDFFLYLNKEWNLTKLEIASRKVKPVIIDEPELLPKQANAI